jgi:hypothetical protein
MENEKDIKEVKVAKSEKEKCGIIMPISTLDGCNEQHWLDVKNILTESIESANFEANLVSNADDVGIIQKTIIQNIYDNPIIVCDVSGKNPNVMFELGMRLAFDKPTIIVKDDKTSYSFDTSPIEHLTYPRDLRFNKIVEFKKDLSEKIKGTFKKSKEDKNFSTFLKHFGKFTVAKLETTEVSKEEFIIEELRDLRYTMQKMFQRDVNIRHKLYELDSIEHSRCEEIIYITLKEIMAKMNIQNPKEISNPKFRKILLSQILNSSNMPPCFEPDKELCHAKINDMIEKIIMPNMQYSK